jgi:arsenate reductase-like glutaredoxin family protein
MKEAGNEKLTSAKARKIMLENTSIIKRPIIEVNGSLVIGFDDSNFEIQFLKR